MHSDDMVNNVLNSCERKIKHGCIILWLVNQLTLVNPYLCIIFYISYISFESNVSTGPVRPGLDLFIQSITLIIRSVLLIWWIINPTWTLCWSCLSVTLEFISTADLTILHHTVSQVMKHRLCSSIGSGAHEAANETHTVSLTSVIFIMITRSWMMILTTELNPPVWAPISSQPLPS